MTDPSFARQIITFTTAHVGNYGGQRRGQGVRPHPRRRGDHARGHRRRRRARCRAGLADVAARPRRPGHRRRGHARARPPHPRRTGAMRGGIFAADMPESEARERVDAEPSMVGRDLAREVTTPEPRVFEGYGGPRIVALDTGIKHSIIRNFTSRGATLELYPCTTSAEELLARDPDGFFLVPGPGDPAALGLHRRDDPCAAGGQAGVRDLPRPPAALSRGGAGDLQAAVRPPRRQPPGQGPAHGADRDHVAEPRLRRGGEAGRADRVRRSARSS